MVTAAAALTQGRPAIMTTWILLAALHERLSQFARAASRRLDRVHQRRSHAAVFQSMQPGDGCSAGRGDHVLEPRMLVRLQQQFRRPEKRLRSEELCGAARGPTFTPASLSASRIRKT